MKPEELDKNYQKNKSLFHDYIDKIKKNSPLDIYTIVNPTLIKNPYASDFPKSFFVGDVKKINIKISFIKIILKFYIKNFYLLFSYLIAFILYRIYYKKQRKNNLKIIIDIFGLVDNVNNDGKFSENYLSGVYNVFEKHNINYAILLRLYGTGKNPFKLIKFFKIIEQDERDFIFEYELFKLSDYIKIFNIILLYPFKTLRLLQKENNIEDKIFNQSLILDIKYFSFDSISRYILGQNLAKINSIEKIFSWSEFQVIERSFNYSIRTNSDKIILIGLQLYIVGETYFNTFIDDIDYEIKTSPHKALVNGKHYIKNRKLINYDIGVSLRYKNIFNFKSIKEGSKIILLGSYIEVDTKYMLESLKNFKNVIFKNHPAVDINKFGKLPLNITVSSENLYNLFSNTNLIITSESGTSVEAAACGISVIIIASQDNLTANPLVDYGKGKIWDIAFSKDDVKKVYNELIEYRKNNIKEIKEIASWYKDNFFVEPTEENILKVFELTI